MASLNFSQIKQAKIKEKLVVYGYLRQYQSLLPSNNSYYNIPELVYLTCIAFYRQIEYFTKHGKYIKLNNECNKASIELDGKTDTVYGNIDINGDDNCIYLWLFKVLTNRLYYFGIDSSNKNQINDSFAIKSKNKYEYYAAGFNESTVYIYSHKFVTGYKFLFNGGIKPNDEIKMELNTKTKCLKFYMNKEKESKIIINDINLDDDKTYNMAIEMASNRSVKLIDFQQIHS